MKDNNTGLTENDKEKHDEGAGKKRRRLNEDEEDDNIEIGVDSEDDYS